MRRTLVGAAWLLGASLALGTTLVARADAPQVAANDFGRYIGLRGPHHGFLDTFEGTIYLLDPTDEKSCITLDLPKKNINVAALKEQKAAWVPPAAKGGFAGGQQAKERCFLQVGDRLEILDTRTGDIYALEGGLPKGKPSEWRAKDLNMTLIQIAT